MIPAAYVTDSGNTVRWPTTEQDLVPPARSSISPKAAISPRCECTAGTAVLACPVVAIIVLH